MITRCKCFVNCSFNLNFKKHLSFSFFSDLIITDDETKKEAGKTQLSDFNVGEELICYVTGV